MDSKPNNLPLQLTSFIGRASESIEVKQAMSAARLLTLTGPGGCGKTRLAIQAASQVADAYAEWHEPCNRLAARLSVLPAVAAKSV